MKAKRDDWWTALVFRVGRRYTNGLDSILNRAAFSKRVFHRLEEILTYRLLYSHVLVVALASAIFISLTLRWYSLFVTLPVALGLNSAATNIAATVTLLLASRSVQRVIREELVAEEVPTCQHCGYCLLWTVEPTCPECGHKRTPSKTWRERRGA